VWAPQTSLQQLEGNAQAICWEMFSQQQRTNERTPNAHFDRRTCLLGAQQKRVDIIIIIIITRVLFQKKLMMKTSIEDKS
jgi:hypothetical protein